VLHHLDKTMKPIHDKKKVTIYNYWPSSGPRFYGFLKREL